MTPKRLLSKVVLLAMLLITQFAIAQDRTISGKVTDENGNAVAGATVIAKGSAKGAATDASGNFKLSVPASVSELVVSSVGFTTKEVEVAGKTSIDVSLASKNTNLSDVVVVGYGTARKKDVTASVVKIGEKDLNPGPITNPLQQIAGKAAGVTITQVGSEPGVAPSIRIRGITSLIGGNDPLVVVDGVQGNLDLLNQVPPSEIESVDILKDASATALYGSRGAAGVVLVTTKRGRSGKMTLEYSGVVSTESVAKKYEVLNAAEWRAEATKRGISSSADFGGNTDWFNKITRNGFTQNHSVAFGAGANGFSYRASLSAILQDGIVLNTGYKNYIGRLQVTQKAIDNKLTLTANLNSSISQNMWNGPGVIGTAIYRRPTDPVYLKSVSGADSAYFTTPTTFNYVNPYARVKEIVDGAETNNLFGSLRADLEIIPGLTGGFFGSWRKVDQVSGYYLSPKTTVQDAISHNGIASRNSNLTNEKLMDLSLGYKKSFGEHSLDANFIYEWQQAVYQGYFAQGRGFVNDLLTFNALQSADLSQVATGDISSYKNDRTLVSFLGIVNYSYKGRYLFKASFRRDGSSVFGANNKWGNFPSINAAWRISEEDFMRKQKIFNDLKLRLGYGVTGNQQGLGPLNSVRLVNPDGTTFFGGNLIPNFSITQNENKDLKWETRRMFNAGVDFGMLKNKLSGSIDFYYGKTKDLLFDYTVPQPPYPYSSIKANVGTILNTGLELNLSYKAVDKKDLTVILAGNFTTNKATVEELSGSLNGIPLNTDTVRWGAGGTTGVASTNNGILYLIKGKPLGTFMLFQHAGVDAFGNQIIVDRNKNGVIDDNDRSPDRYICGQALPKFTYAFTPSVTYKNFDLSMVWRGAYGNKIYNAARAERSAMAKFGQENVLKSALKDGIQNIDYATDFWLEDGSFLRFDNLTIGYRVNTAKIKYVSSLRFSLTATNIAVITKYSGIDPEVRSDGGNGFGINYGIYPRTRTFAFGVNVSFK